MRHTRALSLCDSALTDLVGQHLLILWLCIMSPVMRSGFCVLAMCYVLTCTCLPLSFTATCPPGRLSCSWTCE
jgi:hypothetical protein